MPKKNSIINNTPPQEKILIEDEEPQTQPELTKPKRQISDAQREHLNNIRSKALEKKAQMKEETLKAKLAKTLEKKELVKKYDEYAEKEKEKPPEKIETQPPKQKKEKPIVYKLAESSSSSSDSSSDDEEEKVVYVKKVKNKNKKQIYHKPKYYQQQSGEIPQQRETLDSTLYKSSQEMLHKRAIEERVRANLIKWNNAMMPQEY
jgi:hypothetical protein